jgi:hypothetical protein
MKDGDRRRGAAACRPEELRGKLHRTAILLDRHAHVLLRMNARRAGQKREQADQEGQ